MKNSHFFILGLNNYFLKLHVLKYTISSVLLFITLNVSAVNNTIATIETIDTAITNELTTYGSSFQTKISHKNKIGDFLRKCWRIIRSSYYKSQAKFNILKTGLIITLSSVLVFALAYLALYLFEELGEDNVLFTTIFFILAIGFYFIGLITAITGLIFLFIGFIKWLWKDIPKKSDLE